METNGITINAAHATVWLVSTSDLESDTPEENIALHATRETAMARVAGMVEYYEAELELVKHEDATQADGAYVVEFHFADPQLPTYTTSWIFVTPMVVEP